MDCKYYSPKYLSSGMGDMLNKILSSVFLIFLTGLLCGMSLLILVLTFCFLYLTSDV